MRLLHAEGGQAAAGSTRFGFPAQAVYAAKPVKSGAHFSAHRSFIGKPGF